ncbi:Holliday junction resolvase RuvX [Candidatus Dependentiae bacterium]|nr:Holliday junction resolvase RuvX [Candidatus Dependentiae bacterium]
MKKLALDIGDKWIGTAISDSLNITCKPYKTIGIENLMNFLESIISEKNISTIIVGHPKTIKGTESLQTKKTVKIKNELEKKFPKVAWILWDERLSSKRADQLKNKTFKTKEEKLKSHSIAAAFILQSYLDNLAFKNL